jgi:hypothetical protein
VTTDIILGCITVLMAVLGGVVSVHAPQAKGTRWSYAIVFIVLGVLAVVFTIKVSREAGEAAGTVKTALNGLKIATDRNAVLEGVNNEQSKQIIALSNKAVGLAQNSILTTTGGDSYCYLVLASNFPPSIPLCIHEGKYPLYDVKARVVDISRMERAMARGEKFVPNFTNDQGVVFGDVPLGSVAVPGSTSIRFSENEFQSFNIFFSARNGLWSEALRLKKVNGNWVTAIQVSRESDDRRKGKFHKTVLYTVTPKEYPLPPKGISVWEEKVVAPE